MTRPNYMPAPDHRGKGDRDRQAIPEYHAPQRSARLRSTVQWDAAAAVEAPRVPWDEFDRQFKWNQSEHVALIGSTGAGKTTLLRAILPRRDYVVIFGTKPVDENLERFHREGYDLYTEWLSVPAEKSPRRLLWPDARDLGAAKVQEAVFRDAMNRIFREGNWCVTVDELWYLAVRLKLADEVRDYLTQSRSLGISFVAGTQRPAWVPLEVYTESTHLFFWKTVEKGAVDRISHLGGANEELVKFLVRRLERHQVLYVNKVTGQMFRTHAPYLPPAPDDRAPVRT